MVVNHHVGAGINPGSSERAISALNHEAVSPLRHVVSKDGQTYVGVRSHKARGKVLGSECEISGVGE